MLEDIAQLIVEGGSVVAILLLETIVLWWLLGVRYVQVAFKPRSVEDLKNEEGSGDALLQAAQEMRGKTHAEKEVVLLKYQHRSMAYRSIILSLIAIAPLLGLLGTVSGMIETFRGLGEQSLFTQTGGVAGGIGEALLTTQVGLIVAAPATVALRALDSKAASLRSHVHNFYVWSNNAT